MKFSIVVPIYQNEENIDDNIPRLLALKNKLPEKNIELIFVDDGSSDSSYKMLIEQWKKNSTDIKIVKLCRNFGQTSAIRAGLSISTGDCVGIISADLQDPPELFFEMIEKWRSGHSVVIAERSEREESLIHQIFSRTYWRLVSKYALKNYPRDGFDFCLIDRKVVSAINKFTEKNTNIFAIIFWLGFSHVIIPYKRALRKKGKSQWTFRKKIRLLIDTFVGFSHLPIRTISYLGVGIFIATLFFILWALYSYIFLGMRYPGWTTLAILISGLGGLILLTLGLIGEYLWRILDESRNRPYYIIEEIKE